MTDIESFEGEIMEIAIEDSDARPTAMAEVETEAIEEEEPRTPRLLLLTRGRTTREDASKTVEAQGTDDGMHQLLVTADEMCATGIFLNVLEQHDFEEDSTMEAMEDVVDMSAYRGWVDGLSKEDRRNRLLSQAQERASRSPHVERYLEKGSWRKVSPDGSVKRVARELYESIDPNPRRCYRNAVVALNAVKSLDRVQYVEGLALPKQAGRPVPHAWLEVDELVAELTWPWHAPVPPRETVYYGAPVETDDVLAVTRRRDGFNPVFLTDEEILSV